MMQEFTQGMKDLMADTIRDVHTAVPGKIVTFDPEKCEATILPTAKFRKPDGSMIDFPKIHEVPVFFPQAVAQDVTFCWHIEPDDEVIIFFTEQALDQWRTGAESNTELRFDLQNAFAMTGFFKDANPHVKRAAENKSIIIQRDESYMEFYGTTGQIDVYATGDINVETEQTLNVKAAVDINVEAGANIDVKAAANITITANANLDIKSTGPMTLESAASIALKAPRIDLN
jgi:hypothetical protein